MIIRRQFFNMVIPSKLNGKKGNCSIPSMLTAEDFVSEQYVPGSLVWAKYCGYPWWPAMVEDDPDEEEYYRKDIEGDEEYHVVFFADKPEKVRRAWVAAKHLSEYIKPPTLQSHKSAKKKSSTALRLSKEIADTALPMSLPERLKKFTFARLSNLKFLVAKKDTKVPKVVVKRNGKSCPDSAIAKKRCRHASAAVDTTNGAATTVPKIGYTAEDAASVSATTVPEIDCNVEVATPLPDVSHAIVISADHLPQTADVKAVSSEIVTVVTSNLPSTIDDTRKLNSLNSVNEELDSEAAEMAAFEKELELYSEDELPSSPECNDPLPEFLRNREMDELFSDCISDDSLGSEDDVASYVMESDSDNEPSPQGTSTEEPIKEKYVHTSEEDIWDINNPKLERTYIWNWND